MTKTLSLALCASLLISTSSFADDKSDIAELKQQVKELQEMTQVLVDETSDLKTGFNYTTVDETKTYSGLGAAASKVYYSKSPLSIGGYGEMYYSNTKEAVGTKRSVVDVYRFVPYIGYKFTENIILNTELEFEHGGSDDGDGLDERTGGYAKVEFMYLDFLMHKNINLRVGNMLVPMDLVNERHEPTLFTTVQRPTTENLLIPSTWHESGVMAYGKITDGLDYKVMGLTALRAQADGEKWLRNGRGGSFKNKNPEGAIVGRVDYSGLNGLLVGASAYGDNALTMWDVHADYKVGAARVYGVYTQTNRTDTNTSTDVTDARGGYINASYDVFSLIKTDTKLPVFVQYENINPQAKFEDGSTKDITGTSQHATQNISMGINYFPHSQVVLKADYVLSAQNGKTDKTASLSMGFIF